MSTPAISAARIVSCLTDIGETLNAVQSSSPRVIYAPFLNLIPSRIVSSGTSKTRTASSILHLSRVRGTYIVIGTSRACNTCSPEVVKKITNAARYFHDLLLRASAEECGAC